MVGTDFLGSRGSLFGVEQGQCCQGDLGGVLLPHSYAFGSAGNGKFQIPPNAELKYEVHLKNFEKVSLLQVSAVLRSAPALPGPLG